MIYLVREIVLQPESIHYKDLGIYDNKIDAKDVIFESFKKNNRYRLKMEMLVNKTDDGNYARTIYNFVCKEDNDELNEVRNELSENYKGYSELVLIHSFEYHVLEMPEVNILL